jgi:large subunit ribosomal protein L13
MTAMQTFSPRPRDIERRWYVVDADGAVLGRLASEVAKILRGKHKPIFSPHMDTGDHVIVVNASAVRLTGNKLEDKIYYRHSNYPGGLREQGYGRLMAERPNMVVEKAIKGMLPKNRLGRAMLKKLAVYDGPEHPHQAQQPVLLGLGEIPQWDGLPPPKSPKAAKPKPSASTVKSVRSAEGKAAGARPASKPKASTRSSSAPLAKAGGRTARSSEEETARVPRGRKAASRGAEGVPAESPAKPIRASRKAKAEGAEKVKQSKGSEESKDTKGTSRRSRTKRES